MRTFRTKYRKIWRDFSQTFHSFEKTLWERGGVFYLSFAPLQAFFLKSPPLETVNSVLYFTCSFRSGPFIYEIPSAVALCDNLSFPFPPQSWWFLPKMRRVSKILLEYFIPIFEEQFGSSICGVAVFLNNISSL